MTRIEVIDYTPAYARSFKELNEAWINQYFVLEEDDIATLNHPDKILKNGGFIWVALYDRIPVGVCALRKKNNDTFELSKMAVASGFQGIGIGRKLGEVAVTRAKDLGADRLYLEGNTLLESSIHLYKKLGFQKVDGCPSTYKRVNIVMELRLR